MLYEPVENSNKWLRRRQPSGHSHYETCLLMKCPRGLSQAGGHRDPVGGHAHLCTESTPTWDTRVNGPFLCCPVLVWACPLSTGSACKAHVAGPACISVPCAQVAVEATGFGRSCEADVAPGTHVYAVAPRPPLLLASPAEPGMLVDHPQEGTSPRSVFQFPVSNVRSLLLAL